MTLGIYEGKEMNLEKQSTTLQRRTLEANNFWRLFLSEMPLREENLHSLSHSQQANIKAARDSCVSNALLIRLK